MSYGPFGKRVSKLPVDRGGTNASTAADARRELDVPSLSADNTFTGVNTFTAATGLFVSGEVTANSITASGAESTFAVVVASDVDMSGRAACAGGLSVRYVAKTADYEITTADCIVDVTANSPTITLPTAVGAMGGNGLLSAGHLFILKNSGAGTVTLATTSSQTIDGAAPGTIAAGGVLRLFSDGANWQSW